MVAVGATMIRMTVTMNLHLCPQITLDIPPGTRRPMYIPPTEASPIRHHLEAASDHLSIAATSADISHRVATSTRRIQRRSDHPFPSLSTMTCYPARTMACSPHSALTHKVRVQCLQEGFDPVQEGDNIHLMTMYRCQRLGLFRSRGDLARAIVLQEIHMGATKVL